MERTIKMDISVGTGIFKAVGRQDIKIEQNFKEFIDNSTSSFFDHEDVLSKINQDGKLHVDITWDDDKVIIWDDAFGMNQNEFNRAIKLNAKPEKIIGNSRNKYGLGLKYAISSLGSKFRIESTAYGSSDLFIVDVDIDQLAEDEPNSLLVTVQDVEPKKHYTKIVVKNLYNKVNNTFGNRLSRFQPKDKVDKLIKKLAKIYRIDIEDDKLELRVNDKLVIPVEPEYLQKETGGEYFTTFSGDFIHAGKKYEYEGTIGVLKKGDSSDDGAAGLSLIQKNRALQINYKPEMLFGKSNDFRRQRVYGHVQLEGDNWVETFTKDSVKWSDDGLQEEFLTSLISIDEVKEIFKVAKEYRVNASKLDPTKLAKIDLQKDFSNTEDKKPISKIERIIDETVLSKSEVVKEKKLEVSGNIVVPINNDHISLNIIVDNGPDSEKNWIKITTPDNTKNRNEYNLIINDRVQLLENYTSKESQKLIPQMAICVSAALLASIKEGIKEDEVAIIIKNLNSLLNKGR